MSDEDQPGTGDIGSVGEEAAKLLGALSEWARDHGPDVGHGVGQSVGQGVGQNVGGLAGHVAASLRDLNDHIATGSPECAYCPICRTVHVVRETSPEVKAHLMTAASSLLQAAAAMLATQVPKDGTGRTARVERIDLDDGAGDGASDDNGHDDEPGEV